MVQETVDTLNAAGYEAYNLTASNYDTLETELKTDFASKGLDPNGSYIVVISGEDNGNSSNPNARGLSLPGQDIADDDGGAPTFFQYTYEGQTYWMRYVTVTTADRSTLTRQLTFGVNRTQNTSIWGSIFDSVFSYTIDTAAKVPITTIASLLTAILGNDLPTAQSYDSFIIGGATTWTLQSIEVYDFENEVWVDSQCSEYAITTWSPRHWVYDASIADHVEVLGENITFRTDSDYYFNTTYRKQLAAEYYSFGSRMLDFTNDIVISLENLNGEAFYIEDHGFKFTQTHWLFYDYDF